MSTYTGIIRTEWSGTSGGPGLTQIAVDTGDIIIINEATAQSLVDAMRGFWDTIKANLPNELTLSVSPTIDLYNTATGVLSGSITAPTAPTDVVGQSSTSYAGGAGMKVTWGTNIIKSGRRVRGSTYIVPAASTIYSSTGTVTAAAQLAVNTAAATLLTAFAATGCEMQVWSRPKDAPVARIGVVTPVGGGTVSSKSAILRGRRD